MAEALRVRSAMGSEKRRDAAEPIRKSSRQAAKTARRIVHRYPSATSRSRASATASRRTLPSGSLRAT
jgi:hypothetical protein